MARDLKLDSLHDLAIEDGDLQFVEDGTEVAQSWEIRVLWILGEWYGNLSLGMPWFTTMFKQLVSQEQKRQVIIDMTLSTPGVKAIVSSDESREGRTGLLDFRVKTDYDTLEDLSL